MVHNHKKRRRSSFKKQNDTPNPLPLLAISGAIIGFVLFRRVGGIAGLVYLLVPSLIQRFVEHCQLLRQGRQMYERANFGQIA